MIIVGTFPRKFSNKTFFPPTLIFFSASQSSRISDRFGITHQQENKSPIIPSNGRQITVDLTKENDKVSIHIKNL